MDPQSDRLIFLRTAPHANRGAVFYVVASLSSGHNILWYAKKATAFSAIFSGPAPLRMAESYAIMTVTDEFCEENHMITESFEISREDLKKLLGASSPDASLLYLFLRSGNPPADAAKELNLSESRIQYAAATLRQLGLWQEDRPVRVMTGERPSYSERDVLQAMDQDSSFRSLYGEIQRLLGRTLNTEELKILLGFVRYLGMAPEVISILVSYCRERARQKGNLRNPSLRTIEKEAYAWAERGIETLEDAAAFIQAQNTKNTRLHRLMNLLQIRGRNLTPAEERYATGWLEMGFSEDVLTMAYERTCLNTGGLNWAYMNKILQRWNQQGFHTAEAVQNGDKKPGTRSGERQLDAQEQAAITRMMQEGNHGV